MPFAFPLAMQENEALKIKVKLAILKLMVTNPNPVADTPPMLNQIWDEILSDLEIELGKMREESDSLKNISSSFF
jgi:hypothetical protein